MFKRDSAKLLLVLCLISISFITLFSQESEKTLDFTLRFGQGGFNDRRSDIDKLGGGQIVLDIKLTKYPIALSISGEYYTNSPAPTHPYEISDMTVFNLLYMKKPFKTKRINLFAGGGMGWLQVPKDYSEENTYKGMVCDLEAGASVRVIWKFGFYTIYKYLYAQKKKDSQKIIDFNEHIVLVGLTLNFSI